MADSVGRQIDDRLADWEARLDRLDLPQPMQDEGPAEAGDHLLFVPTPSGYKLVERAGSVPAPGEQLELDEPDGRYAVTRVIPSPLPGDSRSCAYVALI